MLLDDVGEVAQGVAGVTAHGHDQVADLLGVADRAKRLHDVVEVLLLGARTEHVAGGERATNHDHWLDLLGLDVQLDDDVRVDPQHQHRRRADVEVADVDHLLAGHRQPAGRRLVHDDRSLETAGRHRGS